MPLNLIVKIAGAILLVVGVLGCFTRISQNDGALAIAGAILLASATVSRH